MGERTPEPNAGPRLPVEVGDALAGAGDALERGWDAARVRALRRWLGNSQAELADRLGTRQQTVSEWETGASQPRRMSRRLLHLVAEDAGFYDARTRDPANEDRSDDDEAADEETADDGAAEDGRA
jgi:transcriptional regulator with XRE-family HTH domain